MSGLGTVGTEQSVAQSYEMTPPRPLRPRRPSPAPSHGSGAEAEGSVPLEPTDRGLRSMAALRETGEVAPNLETGHRAAPALSRQAFLAEAKALDLTGLSAGLNEAPKNLSLHYGAIQAEGERLVLEALEALRHSSNPLRKWTVYRDVTRSAPFGALLRGLTTRAGMPLPLEAGQTEQTLLAHARDILFTLRQKVETARFVDRGEAGAAHRNQEAVRRQILSSIDRSMGSVANLAVARQPAGPRVAMVVLYVAALAMATTQAAIADPLSWFAILQVMRTFSRFAGMAYGSAREPGTNWRDVRDFFALGLLLWMSSFVLWGPPEFGGLDPKFKPTADAWYNSNGQLAGVVVTQFFISLLNEQGMWALNQLKKTPLSSTGDFATGKLKMVDGDGQDLHDDILLLLAEYRETQAVLGHLRNRYNEGRAPEMAADGTMSAEVPGVQLSKSIAGHLRHLSVDSAEMGRRFGLVVEGLDADLKRLAAPDPGTRTLIKTARIGPRLYLTVERPAPDGPAPAAKADHAAAMKTAIGIALLGTATVCYGISSAAAFKTPFLLAEFIPGYASSLIQQAWRVFNKAYHLDDVIEMFGNYVASAIFSIPANVLNVALEGIFDLTVPAAKQGKGDAVPAAARYVSFGAAGLYMMLINLGYSGTAGRHIALGLLKLFRQKNSGAEAQKFTQRVLQELARAARTEREGGALPERDDDDPVQLQAAEEAAAAFVDELAQKRLPETEEGLRFAVQAHGRFFVMAQALRDGAAAAPAFSEAAFFRHLDDWATARLAASRPVEAGGQDTPHVPDTIRGQIIGLATQFFGSGRPQDAARLGNLLLATIDARCKSDPALRASDALGALVAELQQHEIMGDLATELRDFARWYQSPQAEAARAALAPQPATQADFDRFLTAQGE